MARTTPAIFRVQHEGEKLLVCSYAIPPPCFAALTPAELAVAVGILDGLSAREIAQGRAVSKRTVGNQIAHIYAKLGIASRYELLALVARTARGR
ncbi:MAG TPA: helix-turn-helix transcriptional regulator [Candidatus Limnocylindrales bacterium]|nr:helix-turn-helix transcriptional regulator [Candidatus Limnocylindrales bacterium]